MLAIIGGTGLSQMAEFKSAGLQRVATPYSRKRVQVELFQTGDSKLAFLPRHGRQHAVPPHKINYRANIWALHKIGVSRIIAVSAVGGIHESLAPGTFAVPDQVIDYTTGRDSTFFEEGLEFVTHVDFTWPFDRVLRQQLLATIVTVNAQTSVMNGGVYGCTQGPRLETAAEIKRMQRDGCDLVGMTAMPEAVLARELNIPYAMLALSVNRAAGLGADEISMAEIQATVERGMGFVMAVLGKLAAEH